VAAPHVLVTSVIVRGATALLEIRPALTVENSLPFACGFSLWRGGGGGADGAPAPVYAAPGTKASLYALRHIIVRTGILNWLRFTYLRTGPLNDVTEQVRPGPDGGAVQPGPHPRPRQRLRRGVGAAAAGRGGAAGAAAVASLVAAALTELYLCNACSG
jgi:hypothetical protein